MAVEVWLGLAGERAKLVSSISGGEAGLLFPQQRLLSHFSGGGARCDSRTSVGGEGARPDSLTSVEGGGLDPGQWRWG